MKIHKYPLSIGKVQTIRCMRPLSAIEQDDEVKVYVVVDDVNPEANTDFAFIAVGTGWEISEFQTMQFLNTVKLGDYVYHVLVAHYVNQSAIH